MRKSGWAAAAGIASAALLLTACGGSSSTSTNAGSGGATPTTGAASTSKPNPGSTSQMSSPPPGAVYFGVSHSKDGWVMAEGDGSIVYTYAGDSAGKPATCTGVCAQQWPPVTGTGLTSLADHTLPGKFAVIGNQVTYNGLPLYTFKGELPYQNHEGGQWKSITLPPSLIISG
jgi:predicted lipoprotein with Yx(FWY)xxD motif